MKVTSEVQAEVILSTIDESSSVHIKGYILNCKLMFVDADMKLDLPDRYNLDGCISCEISPSLDSHVMPVEIVVSGDIPQRIAKRY